MTDQTRDSEKLPKANCGVNSTFNFVVGGVSIVAALVILYFARAYF